MTIASLHLAFSLSLNLLKHFRCCNIWLIHSNFFWCLLTLWNYGSPAHKYRWFSLSRLIQWLWSLCCPWKGNRCWIILFSCLVWFHWFSLVSRFQTITNSNCLRCCILLSFTGHCEYARFDLIACSQIITGITGSKRPSTHSKTCLCCSRRLVILFIL